MDALHPSLNHALLSNREFMRITRQKGNLPMFTEVEFVVVPHKDFYKVE